MLAAGPYAPAAGQTGTTAIDADDPAIIGWASTVADYSPGTNADAVWQQSAEALGKAEGVPSSIVSLGRGGSLTLGFSTPIRDGLGADFAVFENSFSDTFLELGFVEVSSDGVNYVRFDSDSRTPQPVGSFGSVDPTNLNNLAGKYRGGFGTPFDLGELRARPGLDVTRVTHVRLIDIIGDGNTLDTSGDPIYDPTPTNGSAGLDVDGVGVIHAVATGEVVIDFETLGEGLGDNTFDNGSGAQGGFTEKEISLNNDYNSQWQSWSGWAISQSTDTTTAGFTNQFGNIVGAGVENSETFAVAYYSVLGASAAPSLTLDPASGSTFDSFYVTNATYAALSMRDGDQFAKKFGGADGNDPDFLRLTVTGVGASGDDLGNVEVMLADFRFADNSQDFILDAWIRVDVSSLSDARSLRFSIDGSDTGSFGLNTPAYFAVDNVTLRRAAVPFDLQRPETREDQPIVGRVSRPTADTSTAITVTLDRDNSNAAGLPETVTIPVGAPFTEFQITPVNDNVPSADRVMEITASAENLLPTTRSLAIRDDEALGIAFTSATTNVTEGAGTAAAMLTLTRNDGDISQPLTVTLSHDTTSLLSVPPSVSFAADERQITIPIEVLDDDRYGSGQSIVITAAADGRAAATTRIAIAENDLPSIQWESSLVRLNENAPQTTRTINVARNTEDTSNPVTITLTLPDGGPITVPGEVTILAGQSSGEVTVGVIDDSLVNSLPRYRIQASHSDLVSASIEVEITDNDTAGLQIEMRDLDGNAITEIPEATPFQVHVRRTAVRLDVIQEVTIATSLGERVTGPKSLTIASGSDSASTTLQVQRDGIVGQPVAIVIDATADGFVSASGNLAVTNSDPRSLRITAPDAGLSESDALQIGDFESFASGLLPGEFDNNSGEAGEFISGPFSFANSFSNAFGFDFWSGFAVSRGTDGSTPGFGNQYSAVTGTGADNSPTYAVAFAGSSAAISRDVSSGPFESLEITNTTYAALSMRDGDSFAKKFGGESGDDPDFFLLTIDGLDAAGISIGQVEFYLADFRFDDNASDNIVDEWTTIDVSSIGDAASLSMSLSSSDNGSFGMNTPAYFAIDNLTFTPALDSLPTITIERSSDDISLPLDVGLSDNRNDLLVPAVVTIPAGQTQVTVPVYWIDNEFADGIRVWQFGATAAGYTGADATISLIDDETPALTLAPSTESISESAGTQTIDFEDIGSELAAETRAKGENQRGGFTSGSLSFSTAYETTFGSWSGWAVSNMTDVTTPGFTNQFSVYATDTSAATFAVAGGYGATPPTITMPDSLAGGSFESIAITNTTYAALSMLQGDSFAKQFGGETGDDPDFFLLQIEGVDDAGGSVGVVDFYLADYRFDDNSLDYVVDDWTTVDLTSLTGATSLRFGLSSSDVGNFGMNTPAYLAIDDVQISRSSAPEPTLLVHRNTSDVSTELTVTFENSDSTRVSLPESVVIPAGVTSVRVPVSIIDDAMYRGDGSLQISATANGLSAADATMEFVEDERPGILVNGSLANIAIEEGGVAGSFTVRLQTPPSDGPVTISIESAMAGVDAMNRLSLSSTTLTFTVDDWDQTQTVSVSGRHDLLVQENEVIGLRLSDGTNTYAEASAWLELADYQPTEFVLRRDAGFVQLVDESRDLVFGEYAVGDTVGSDVLPVDADELRSLFGDSARRLLVSSNQTPELIGSWTLGQTTLDNGLTIMRATSDAVEVDVTTNRPWQNIALKPDVNGSGDVTSVDALTIINRLNADPSSELAMPQSEDELPTFYYDVSGDSLVTSLDALQVINWLNEYDFAGDSPDSAGEPLMGIRGLGAATAIADHSRKIDNFDKTGTFDPRFEPKTSNDSNVKTVASSIVTTPEILADEFANRSDERVAAIDSLMGDLEFLASHDSLVASEPWQ